jgi:hypothetical protein
MISSNNFSCLRRRPRFLTCVSHMKDICIYHLFLSLSRSGKREPREHGTRTAEEEETTESEEGKEEGTKC